MVKANENNYVVTDQGRAKTNQTWDIAEAHAKETFESFSDADAAPFNKVLRQLISQ